MNLKTAFLILLAGWGTMVQAQTPDIPPDVLVRQVTNEVLQVVRGDKKAIRLIEAKMLPHFDFTRMTQLAAGQSWKSATVGQQKQLAEEFQALLVRTYAKALIEYGDKSIDIKPLAIGAGDSEAKVITQVTQAGGKPIRLDYYLEKLGAEWKVYDIEVDGISLVTNYRALFATEVRNGGIEGLIMTLQGKNKISAAY
jgi:phospholipid transport system substrate-binding protein